MGLLDDDAIESAKGLFGGQKGKSSGGLGDFFGNKKNKGGGVTSKLGGLFGNGGGGGDSDGGVGGALGGLLGGGGFPPGGDGGGGLDKAKKALEKNTTASGKPAKLHESPEAAKAELLSGKEKPAPKGTFMDETSSIGESSTFGTTHIRPFVRNEFARREQNFGMYYTENGEFADNVGITDNGDGTFTMQKEFGDSYDDTIYRGPKAAWMRVISNAIGPDPDVKDGKIYGFEMHGWHGKNGGSSEDPVGFHEQYGFDKNSGQATDEAKTYLGRGWKGEGKGAQMCRHEILEADFKHRPSPGITSIASEDKEPGRNYREVTINFVVWSRNQLDYMDKYFFKLGVTICTEWGWNTYPRNGVVVDPTDLGKNITKVEGSKIKKNPSLLEKVNKMRELDEEKTVKLTNGDIEDNVMYRTGSGTGMIGLFTDPVYANNHLKKGKGNYSFHIGMVSNYSYSLREDGGYDCEVKVTSAAKMAAGLDNQATKVEKDKNSDEREEHFKLFVETKLNEVLEGDTDPNEIWDGFDEGVDDIAEEIADPEFSQGRYFQFDQSISGKDTYHSDHEDSYITLGFLIAIVNRFFEKTSQETNIGTYKFEIESSRCCAHPNIKSTDGKVLLIPNMMSPRRNNKKSERETSYSDTVENDITSWVGKGENAESVLTIINASLNKKNPAGDLKSALERSPRDNLHKVFGSAADALGKPNAVRPFPDFATVNGLPTLGYSGRISDLFVNYNIVRDAVSNGSNITEILKDILKKVSDAAGGVWDFDLVGPNTSSPNNTEVAIVDRRFPGMATSYDLQKENQAYRFKSHLKNSIVKGMSLDVSVATEVAGMVVFSEPESEDEDDEDTDDSGDNPQTSFYSRGREDRLLKQCKSPDKTMRNKKIKKPKEDKGFFQSVGESIGLLDDEEDIEDEAKFIIGSPSVGTRWLADHDIECVDIDRERMVRSMKKDDNKLNCIKNNMPLDGCEISISLDGIEGIRLLDVFTCTGVPTHYFMNGLWRTQSVSHNVSDNNWITEIKGEYIPSVKQG